MDRTENEKTRRPPAGRVSVAQPAINGYVRQWIDQCIDMCQPENVYWCDGSPEERQTLLKRAVKEGALIELNQEKLPNCYLHRSNPNDVARSEQATFICTPSQDMAGPTNNWMETRAAYTRLRALFSGCMKGRTMYVVPFVMGPIGSPLAKVGVELTDSIYVAISMGIMTRMGTIAWRELDSKGSDPNIEPEFTRCLHSVGDCSPERRYICHFPMDNTIWSFGSGYGGNALLGKKCLALRIASFLGSAAGLDGGAYAADGGDEPGGGEDVCRGGVSKFVREDEFRDADSAGEVSGGGMEDYHGGG